ncbi:MAG: hypothetical protein ACTSSO_06195 [Candidatus Hodarchaeales archaeon]
MINKWKNTTINLTPNGLFSSENKSIVEPINKWKNTTINLTPNGLFSSENKSIVEPILEELSKSRMNQLLKLSLILQLTGTKEVDIITYFPGEEAKVKGKFSLIDLCEHAILFAIDITSRTRSLRDCIRFIFLPTINRILVEQKPLSSSLLKGEILPYLSKEPDEVTSKRIRARLIKKLATSTSDPEHRLNILSLKIKISLETSGIEGLQHIIIEGENVIRGVETLEQRHEISLQFLQSGPWVGIGTDDFQLEIGKGVKIHQLESESFKRLNTVLNWY